MRGVARPYGDQNQWFAVKDVELDVYEGEFVAVIGPSGSGKSTLLNILGLLDNTWSGTYLVNGVDVQSAGRRQRDALRASTFGFVFQSSFSNGYESASRNASLGLEIQGRSQSEQRRIVSEALRLVGLDAKAEELARYLSGGERQRLAIARAISTGPRIILADEPTGNLDSKNAALVMQLLSDLNKAGATVIIVTHDQTVAAHAHRAIQVRDGEVLSSSERPSVDSPLDAVPLRRLLKVSRKSVVKSLLAQSIRSVNNVTSRPVRSIALIGAFCVAIAGMIAASGVGASASQQIADRLSAAALDEVWVSFPNNLNDSERENWVANLDQLDHVVGVGRVVAVDATAANVGRFANNNWGGPSGFRGRTLALDGAALSLYEAKVWPASSRDEFANGNVALVGQEAASALGIAPDSFESEVWVQGRPYTVGGIVESSARSDGLEESVLVPIAQGMGGEQVLVRTSSGYSAAVAEAIPLTLSPAAPAEVAVTTTGDLRNLRVGVSSDLNGLLNSVSFALMILAILSASSAMFLSVQSRVQELALSRALGMSRTAVAGIFIWEGVVVGLAGALAGIALGLSFAVLVAATRGWTAVVPWSTLAIAPLVGVLCGALSAVVPALRAAKVDPADAIR